MQKQIINLSKKLISIPSVTGDAQQCNKVLDLVKKELEGFNLKEFEQNKVKSLLFYNTKTFPKKFKIILNAHLDVVPGKPTQFKPKVKGNMLFGRGAYDMKSAGAVMILVFKYIAQKLNYPLGLQIVMDEETGGFDGTLHQLEKGVRSDFAIMGEPSGFDISTKSKGILRFYLQAKGESSHGAYPWHGKNALESLLKAVAGISKAFPTPRKEVWRTTVTLVNIKTGNDAENVVPGSATAQYDVRFVPKDKQYIRKKIQNILPDNVEYEVYAFESPHDADNNNKYIKLLCQTTKNIIKREVDFVSKHGGSDSRMYSDLDIQSVNFGPAGHGLHKDDEWVDIESLLDYYKILSLYLESIEK